VSQGHGGAFSFTSSIVYLKECLWSKEQRYGQSKGEEDILKRQLMKQLLLGLLSVFASKTFLRKTSLFDLDCLTFNVLLEQTTILS
jgi:hypothetical protein